jgi:hypothetical protein
MRLSKWSLLSLRMVFLVIMLGDLHQAAAEKMIPDSWLPKAILGWKAAEKDQSFSRQTERKRSFGQYRHGLERICQRPGE